MTFVVIEDDPNMVRLIRDTIERSGIPVDDYRHADNLHDGGNLAAQFMPDIVILDLGLTNSEFPEKSSRPSETVDASRQLCRTFPVIILTGYDDAQFWRKTIRNGASDYLFKGTFLARGNELFLAHAINTAYYRSPNLKDG